MVTCLLLDGGDMYNRLLGMDTCFGCFKYHWLGSWGQTGGRGTDDAAPPAHGVVVHLSIIQHLTCKDCMNLDLEIII